ncbi:MAG: sugar ABC transporter ATP-binding protein [Erysipelotrichaceae bacterium]|nr:sugar ABC transporter ATP-binding protein [Erysipelotrichaceae bacterium]
MQEREVILSLRDVSKKYYGVPAIENISFDIYKGEIFGIVGENGAGKSTLIKTVAGAIPANGGEIWFKGEKLELKSPYEAISKGIGVVYQEFNLFPNLMVYENIFFGVELKKNGLLDRRKMIEESKKILAELGFDFDVRSRVSDLSPAFQQATEVAKCINHQVELIIMDEPSAPLTEKEVDQMFKVVRKLNDSGITIIYISHKLKEIMDLTDRVSVLRDGHYITTFVTKETTENELIKNMVGREITDIYPEKVYSDQDVILRVNGLNSDKVHDVSFELRKGEVLGFGGLVGAGRTETMRLLYGADKKDSGTIILNGKEVTINSPTDAISNGIGLIPEDRKAHGLILNKDIYLNCLLPSLKRYSNNGFIDFKTSKKDIGEYYDRLKIKATGQDQLCLNLSGGNQQKVVLEKWLLKDCEVLILDEPTRGIDVGTKQEIYQLIKDLALSGKGVIVISSEMPELIGVSHRILVMHEGRITGELTGDDITQEAIMTLAS